MKKDARETIRVYSALLKSNRLEKIDVNVIDHVYCPNGHSLITDHFTFCDFKAIYLKIRDKKFTTNVFISPVMGDKNKATIEDRLDRDVTYEFLCPECNVSLPLASPCSCGGSLVALYLDKSLKLSKSVTICNRFGCQHCEVEGIDQLKKMHL